jgi:hypothetical protein
MRESGAENAFLAYVNASLGGLFQFKKQNVMRSKNFTKVAISIAIAVGFAAAAVSTSAYAITPGQCALRCNEQCAMQRTDGLPSRAYK